MNTMTETVFLCCFGRFLYVPNIAKLQKRKAAQKCTLTGTVNLKNFMRNAAFPILIQTGKGTCMYKRMAQDFPFHPQACDGLPIDRQPCAKDARPPIALSVYKNVAILGGDDRVQMYVYGKLR